MSDFWFYLGLAFVAALATYCLWRGITALRSGTVESPTALSLGATKRTDAPLSYWLQVAFWILGAGAFVSVVVKGGRGIVGT